MASVIGLDPSVSVPVRLFVPRASQRGPSTEWRLSRFYRDWVVPIVLRPADSAARNYKEYETSLRHWTKFVGDPPLGDIDAFVCAAFVERVKSLPGKRGGAISPNTVRKHARAIQYLLDFAGPQSRDCRNAIGLLDAVPYIERPNARKKLADDAFTLDEIRAWLAACEHEPTPVAYHPHQAAWWAGLIRWLYYTGLRIETGLAARWDWIAGRWITIPGEFYKGGQPHRFWLSDRAIAAAESLRRITGSVVIAHWPHSPGYLQKRRVEILARAGLPADRRLGFHGLRKALGTELWKLNPGIAQMVLGHEKDRTTREHYVRPDAVSGALEGVGEI